MRDDRCFAQWRACARPTKALEQPGVWHRSHQVPLSAGAIASGRSRERSFRQCAHTGAPWRSARAISSEPHLTHKVARGALRCPRFWSCSGSHHQRSARTRVAKGNVGDGPPCFAAISHRCASWTTIRIPNSRLRSRSGLRPGVNRRRSISAMAGNAPGSSEVRSGIPNVSPSWSTLSLILSAVGRKRATRTLGGGSPSISSTSHISTSGTYSGSSMSALRSGPSERVARWIASLSASFLGVNWMKSSGP
jgi:hypothetical protein